MANTPKKTEPQSGSTSDDKSKASGELAEPTFGPGEQAVDPKKDQVLPETKPEDLAPLVGTKLDGSADDKPEPSSTGYRVKAGKSVQAKTGDLLNSGEEIGEKHVDGGADRLGELEAAGVIEKVGGGSPSAGSTSENKPPPENKPEEKKGFFGT